MTLKTQKEWQTQVQAYAKELKLPMIRKHVADFASEANLQDI